MTSPSPPQLLLTIAERSIFDGIRIRWGGLGSFGVGVGLLFTEQAAGVVFGIERSWWPRHTALRDSGPAKGPRRVDGK
jgi:hypothetical protein